MYRAMKKMRPSSLPLLRASQPKIEVNVTEGTGLDWIGLDTISFYSQEHRAHSARTQITLRINQSIKPVNNSKPVHEHGHCIYTRSVSIAPTTASANIF
jgi:hypothetical protein